MKANKFHFALALFFVANFSVLFAREIVVGKSGVADFDKIQSAIDAAKNGDTIVVKPGLYKETLNINKAVTIKGERNEIIKHDVSMFGENMWNKDADFRKSDSYKQNFYQNELFWNEVRQNQTKYVDERVLVLVDNRKTCKVTAPASIEGIAFTHNRNVAQLMAEYFNYYAFYKEEELAFLSWVGVNEKEEFSLVEVSADAKFYDVACYCSGQYGLEVSDGSPKFNSCYVYWSARSGVLISAEATPEFVNCLVKFSGRNGVVAYEFSNPKFFQCMISDNIQNGLAVQENATGTYKELYIFRNGFDGDDGYSGIGVFHDSSPTVIDSYCNENRNAGLVVRQRSRGIFRNNKFHKNGTHGVLVREESEPIIENCEMSNNKSFGIYFINDTTAIVQNCEIKNNSQSGASFSYNSRGSLENCAIHDNKSFGVYVEKNAAPLVNECEVYKNTSSGILIRDNARGIYNECNVYENRYNGFFVLVNANPTVAACMIRANRNFGIELKDNAKGNYNNCTIKENRKGAVEIAEGIDVQINFVE